MAREIFAARLAGRFRIPIALVAAFAAVLAAASLITRTVPDAVTAYSAIGVGAGAALMFICAIADPKLHNAMSALNADRRRQAREMGLAARMFGWGLPTGDRLLFPISIVLLGEFLFSTFGSTSHSSAAALSFAGFFLTSVARMALMAQEYPSDEFKGIF